MAKKKKGGKKGKKGKKGKSAAKKFDQVRTRLDAGTHAAPQLTHLRFAGAQAEYDRTMSTLPEPTPLPEEIGHWVCRVNELVRLRFPTDPEGLVAELQENPKNPDGLDARNECGWTALMRSARDGLKHHVVALVNAGADVELTSTAAVTETHTDDDQVAGGFKAPLGAPTEAGRTAGQKTVIEYPAGCTAADLCRLRHGRSRRTVQKQGKGEGTVSTQQNCDEILQILENARLTADEVVSSDMVEEKAALRALPTYHRKIDNNPCPPGLGSLPRLPAGPHRGLAQPGLVTSMSSTPRDTPISYHSVPETAGSLERPLVAQGYYADLS